MKIIVNDEKIELPYNSNIEDLVIHFLNPITQRTYLKTKIKLRSSTQ